MNRELKRQVKTHFGLANIVVAEYVNNHALAVRLVAEDGEPIATLSSNMKLSGDLPPDCFFLKDWAENVDIACDALRSGWFKIRRDLPTAISGLVWADAVELLDVRLTKGQIATMLEEAGL